MGAYFEVHFEKGREFHGEDSKAFLAKLTSEGNVHSWEVSDLEASTFDQVVEKTNLGLLPHEIAAELDVNKSTVSRHQKRAREEGLIKKTP
jgi:FixJ family two-component response regulator